MIQTVIGKRGRGKTTLVKELISDSPADFIYILDFLGEYSTIQDERIVIERGGLYEFCQFAWESSSPETHTLVIFDEIDLYGIHDPHISFLYRYGRHVNLDLIGVSRRFYDIPVITRALTDEFLFFQVTEERDLQYLKRLVPENYIQVLINLPMFHYVKLAL